jgi:hypothetical protein
MPMNRKKMNNYSQMHVSTVLVLTIALVTSTFAFPTGIRTSATSLNNGSPYIPNNPGPANGSTNVSVYIDYLNWTGGDPDGDLVVYDIYFGTVSPPEKVQSNQSDTTYDPGDLEYDTLYYWMIIAWDNSSNSATGPQWHFTTKSNVPPNIPSGESPANGSTDISVYEDLTWTGGDPDNDPVTYDVYFGNMSPPVLVIANQSTTSYEPNDMEYDSHYYWMIIAWDNQNASAVGPQWEFTTKSNVPPSTPSNPSPANGVTSVALDATLSWTGGDPDGDPVTYDVYFGLVSPPPKVVSNQSDAFYNPGSMNANTLYYWRIIAWDNQNSSASGPDWQFTTKQESVITVNITKPLEKTFYLNDQARFSLLSNTIVYGKITITANVTSESAIDYVIFTIDGKLQSNDTEAPYECLWQPIIQFNGMSLKHTIKVVAYDVLGNNASDELNVTKWRFHPLPFILGAAAIASGLILHTTVTGFVYNLQQARFGTEFYALRIHYKTVGPFKSSRGIITSKHCTGGILIGPITQLKLGPFHKFAWISCTFLGGIRQDSSGFGNFGSSGRLSQKLFQLLLK